MKTTLRTGLVVSLLALSFGCATSATTVPDPGPQIDPSSEEVNAVPAVASAPALRECMTAPMTAWPSDEVLCSKADKRVNELISKAKGFARCSINDGDAFRHIVTAAKIANRCARSLAPQTRQDLRTLYQGMREDVEARNAAGKHDCRWEVSLLEVNVPPTH